ncbi:pentapeptide repeat-containing protein [Jiangella gansuensis]|uniref:pentapeptide repeat-containing protein n=1 Tax=Jiangella gansuensis TaxID=281473 RepID=UPI0004BB7D80|nr:hypothetical protein [Jiangella gansuensis]
MVNDHHTGREFERMELSGARFDAVDLTGATIRHSALSRVVMRRYAERDLAVLEGRS